MPILLSESPYIRVENALDPRAASKLRSYLLELRPLYTVSTAWTEAPSHRKVIEDA